MAPDSCLLEFHSARLNLTLPQHSWRPPIPPSLPQWARSRPLPIHAAPAYWPLLGTEARPAVAASPVAIGAVAAVHRLEHFRSSVSAIWATHRASLLPPGCRLRIPTERTPRPNHSFLLGRNGHPARIASEDGLRRGPRVSLGDLEDSINDIESKLHR